MKIQKRIKAHPPLLMAVSLLLLLVLQGLWLQTEYKNAVNSFSRETNFTLRSTLHQLSDSLFFSKIDGITSQDSIDFNFQKDPISNYPRLTDTIGGITVTTFRDNNAENEADTNNPKIKADDNEITIAMKRIDPDEDSVLITRHITGKQDNIRWFFSSAPDGYNSDSIASHYIANLNTEYQRLRFVVLEKDFDFSRPRQHPRTRNDSLPFTTSFYPFASKLYAVEFENGNLFILGKLAPQIIFSLFTTTLIVLSFVMIYRSLRTQRKLMEQKDNFVSNITHELKTPVASVGVALEAIKNFNVIDNPAKTIEYIDLAARELNRLSVLTDKILRSSVMDSGSPNGNHKEPVNLSVIILETVAAFDLMAREKGVNIDVQIDEECVAFVNREHFGQALYNLIDNGLKYGANGKWLGITLKKLNGSAVISVADKGPGIASEHQKKIFEKFYRIPSGNLHDVKGYGLGLHYAALVAADHNGKIGMESEPGKGSVFHLQTPIAKQ